MRIAILTQYFLPEMGAPQARLSELAVRLRNRGHAVTIITAMPNYPTGRVFDEYRWRVLCREKLDGLRVIRTPIFPSKSANLLVRLASYMSFVSTSLALGTLPAGKQDVLIVESPPLFLALSGVPMSRLLGAKMVLMVSDIWPDVAVRMGDMISERQVKILERLEAWAYRHSSCVALTNPGAVEQVTSRFPNAACSVISNGVDTSLFRPELRSADVRREFGVGADQFAVGYCGLHGLFQGLEVVIDAARRLRDQQHIRFVMIGDGPTKERLVNEAHRDGLANLTFFPRQPKKCMPRILASLDASLIPLAASLPGTMPSKVYEALAAGVPMLVTAGCEAQQLVERYGVGRTFAAGNGQELADAILEISANAGLRETMKSNAVSLAKRFDRDVIVERTEALLRAVCEGRNLPAIEW